MVKIAGRRVKVGDRLYHRSLQAWGDVTNVETSLIKIRISGIGHSNAVTLIATTGGIVSNRRQLYWHEPIDLDLPTSDVSKVQRVVDFFLELL